VNVDSRSTCGIALAEGKRVVVPDKVLVNAYTQQLYSSRKIAKALRENIYFFA